MKETKNKVRQIIRDKLNKNKEESKVSFTEMALFRRALDTVSSTNKTNCVSGVIITGKKDKSIVMIHSLDIRDKKYFGEKIVDYLLSPDGTPEKHDHIMGKLSEFIIMPTSMYEEKYKGKLDVNCGRIITSFNEYNHADPFIMGDLTLVPAGVLMYEIRSDEDIKKMEYYPTNTKLETIYTDRNMRGNGVAARLLSHFHTILKRMGYTDYHGYARPLDNIVGRNGESSAEALYDIYTKLGMALKYDKYGTFMGSVDNTPELKLPQRYILPKSLVQKDRRVELEKPLAIIDEGMDK